MVVVFVRTASNPGAVKAVCVGEEIFPLFVRLFVGFWFFVRTGSVVWFAHLRPRSLTS